MDTTMPSLHGPVHCGRCGARYDADRFGGLCPACAIAWALEAAEEEADAPEVNFAGHALLGELARGGMGVVYRARQLQPEREVALKCLQGMALGAEALRERFRTEARAMANLDHPGVLPIYQFGEADGVPFFTMKLARGGTLADRAAALRGDWREVARLLAEVARAVQYAHDRGILHRDLKPGNILFDEAGRVFVADFGIARILQETALAGEAGETPPATACPGTPAYLAPEAIDGGDYTAAADIWGLGAVLQELLAGGPPFAGETPGQLADCIRKMDPRPALPGVPADLAAIARKALAKAPEQRYRAAREFADDLERWLHGHPVMARPASRARQAVFWARRNPAPAFSALLVVISAAVFVLLQARSNHLLRVALGESYLQEARQMRAADQPQAALAQARAAAGLLPRSRAAEVRSEVAAALAAPDWILEAEWPAAHEAVSGFEAFSPDLEAWIVSAPGGTYRVVDTRSGEVRRTVATATTDQPIRFLTEGPPGRIVSIHRGGHTEILAPDDTRWIHRAESWERRLEPALHPDGERFVHVDGDGVWIGTLEEPRRFRIVESPVEPHPLVLDPRGERLFLLAGDPPVPEVRSVADGTLLYRIEDYRSRPNRAAWSPDGRWLAVAVAEAGFVVRIHGSDDGRLEREFADHTGQVAHLAWHPDGQSLATVGGDQRLLWRSIAAGGFRLSRPAAARALEFDRAGGRLGYSPTGSVLGLLRLEPSAVYRTWPKPELNTPNSGYALALSPDGGWVAVIGREALVFWDARDRRELWRVGLDGPCDWATVGFAGGGLYWSGLFLGLWTAEVDGAGRLGEIWEVGLTPRCMLVETARDGRSLVVVQEREEVDGFWLWPDGDSARARLLAAEYPMVGYRLIPGAGHGFSSHWSDPDIHIWDAASGQRLRGLGLPLPAAGEPSPDGRWLLASTAEENTLWDTADWRRVAAWPAGPGEREVFTAAFSPDARLLAKGRPDGVIELRSVPDAALVLELIPPGPLSLRQVAFSPDGSRLLGLDTQGQIVEWRLEALRGELAAHRLGW
ncbi:MAG: hypothetical protein EA425_16670 [Puniceicoccaceae bacterium]|nr:MAG: hypothetical protein EA425_16670 [Puniceicoccaceae bacterium]